MIMASNAAPDSESRKNTLNLTVFAVVLPQVFGIQVSIAVPH
jgi:hypothetical protein